MKTSAGILLYRFVNGDPEFMLVHPGGPFWKNKEEGAWSIPKGEFVAGEDPLIAARRELKEETGISVDGDFIALDPIKQNSGKLIYAFALEKDVDVSVISSNAVKLEWPPRSGKMISVPEVDKAAWFTEAVAKHKIIPGQIKIIDALLTHLLEN